jgi:ribonuclease P protein component
MARVWRLRPHGEFERVRQQGRSWPHRLLVLIVQPRLENSLDPPRVAVVAGKRLGGAVVRNRLKRRLRAAVQQVAGHIPAGVDLIIMARAPLLEAEMDNIVAALTDVLQRASIWRKD